MYHLLYSTAAQKDAKKLLQTGLKTKCEFLLSILAKNLYQNPPPYEKLIGDLEGCFSSRINIQHRLVYKVFKKEKQVRILRMWSYYE